MQHRAVTFETLTQAENSVFQVEFGFKMMHNSSSSLCFLMIVFSCIHGIYGFLDQPSVSGNTSVSSNSHLLLVDEKIFQHDNNINVLLKLMIFQ